MNKLFIFIACLSVFVANVSAQNEKPPIGGEPKDFTLPSKRVFSMPNGFSATMVQYGSIPKALVRIVIRTGRIDENVSTVWLSNLLGEYLKEGTETMSAQQIARNAARMGGSVDITVQNDQMYIAGEVLSEFVPDFIDLIAEIAQKPLFPASELERLKTNQIRDLSLARAQPQTLATEKFNAVLYGTHPYGLHLSTDEILKSFTVESVRKFHDEHFCAKRAAIYVVGQFDGKSVEQSVRRNFGDWKAGMAPTVNVPNVKSQRAIYLIDRPGAVQSTIYVGLPVIDPSQADYLKLAVMNTLLGGFFSSRITSNIREDKGFTYSPYGFVQNRFRTSYWAEVADVTTSVTGASLKEILYEIDRLRKEEPTVEELDGVKNYQAGLFVLQNSTYAGIANQLGFLALHGLGEQYLTDYVRNVHTITPGDITRMAGHLKDENMVIVIVGDVRKIQTQVESYGTIVP